MGKGFSWEFDVDLTEPLLLKDIALTDDKLNFLRGRVEGCFLCKWLLQDYEKNGTLTGLKMDGVTGVYEIFPIRGEINHLWLELYGKSYPWKRKVTEAESRVHGAKPQAPPAVGTPTDPPPSPSSSPAPTVDDSIPLSKPKRPSR